MEVVDELRRAKGVVEGHGPGGDLRKLCKQKSPALLRLLVGARTNVVTIQVFRASGDHGHVCAPKPAPICP